ADIGSDAALGRDATADQGAPTANGWTPPIGIPAPPFGINEVAPKYDPSNPRHYYVDNTAPNANDANAGGRGSPSAPRLTVPTPVAAGGYVEVHGGPTNNPYVINTPGGQITWTFNCSAAQPCFLKGVGNPIFEGASTNSRDLVAYGSYYVIDSVVLRNF